MYKNIDSVEKGACCCVNIPITEFLPKTTNRTHIHNNIYYAIHLYKELNGYANVMFFFCVLANVVLCSMFL